MKMSGYELRGSSPHPPKLDVHESHALTQANGINLSLIAGVSQHSEHGSSRFGIKALKTHSKRRDGLSELSKILLQKPLEPKFGRQDPSQELSLVRRELVHPRDECLCEFIHGGELVVRCDRCFGLAPQLVHGIELRTLLGKPQQLHLIVGGEL